MGNGKRGGRTSSQLHIFDELPIEMTDSQRQNGSLIDEFKDIQNRKLFELICIHTFNMMGYQSRYHERRVERQNMYKENEEQRPNEEESVCKKRRGFSLSISRNQCLQRISTGNTESLMLCVRLQLFNEISGQSELF